MARTLAYMKENRNRVMFEFWYYYNKSSV